MNETQKLGTVIGFMLSALLYISVFGALIHITIWAI